MSDLFYLESYIILKTKFSEMVENVDMLRSVFVYDNVLLHLVFSKFIR